MLQGHLLQLNKSCLTIIEVKVGCHSMDAFLFERSMGLLDFMVLNIVRPLESGLNL